MGEAGPLPLGSGCHPDGEEPSLHDAPPPPENGAGTHADPERRPDLDLETVACLLEDGERGDVALPQRCPTLEVTRDAPDLVERRGEHTLPKRRLPQPGDEHPHAAHGIELRAGPDAGHIAHVAHFLRKTDRARCSLDFTVPRATPSTRAASTSSSPCRSRRTRMAR